MVKKLHLLIYIFPVLFLSTLSGYGQSCPDGTQTSSVSISTPRNNICAGEEITFTASANYGGPSPVFVWKVNGNIVADETGSSFTTDNLTAATNKVAVQMTTSCVPEIVVSSNEITITTNTNRTPTVAISADKTSLCPFESITFTASNSYGGNTPQYEWYINSGTTVAKTGATATFSGADFNSGGNTVRVVLTSNYTCVTSTTAEATSAIFAIRPDAPAAPGTIEGESSVCPGIALTYSIDAVTNAESYVWSLPTGWTGSSTGTSINVTSGNTGNGTISVIAKNSCGESSTAANLPVTVRNGTPAVPGTITGSTSVCPGVTESYSVSAVAGATSYIWTLPNGNEQTTTTPDIDVTTNATGSSNISVKASNDCGTSAARTLNVSVKPGTPATPSEISGIYAVCPGTTQTYSVASISGASEYIWTVPDGWIGSSNTSSITVTVGTVGGNLSVAAKNDCDTGGTFTQAVTVKAGTPAVASSISGATTVCPGTLEIFSIDSIDGAASYEWTLPNGWSGTSTTTSIEATTGTTGGNITVKAINDCGIGEIKTLAVTVSDPAPVMTGAVTGPEVVCSGSTGITYTIPAITHATTYLWSVPTGWTITGGADTNTITVTPNSASGDVSVIAENSCGKSAASGPLAVKSTTGSPPTPGAITSDLPSSAICPPSNGVHFEVAPVDNATGYNWILPSGWEIVEGDNSNKITVNITTNAAYTGNQSISVEATNICGNSAASSLSGIAIDEYVVADLGEDQVLCSLTASISFNGYVAFGSKESKLSITSISSTGSGILTKDANGKVNNFSISYTPTNDDLEAGQVTFTLTTEKPSGACAAGKDTMTIFFKPLPTATISGTTPVCEGATSTLTFTGTPNSRVTYNRDNGAARTIEIGSSGTVTVDTEALTANSTFNLVSAVNLDTPACTASITGTANVVVTPNPSITSFQYTSDPFCSSIATAQAPSLEGTAAYTGGTYSSTTGLTLNTNTGEITPNTSTPGTYTVTYSTPVGGGCDPVTSTTEVTITDAPTAAITYGGSPFCTSDSSSKAVILTGTNGYTGGVYSAPAGLNIDPATGAITSSTSTPGVYTVTYKTPAAGGCSEISATTEVTITELPTVTINYSDSPFCQADTVLKQVVREGTGAFEGGGYAAPAGLSIDPNTGAIDASQSTPGIYTITYTAPASSGCGEVAATTEIAITESPSAVITYDGPYCTADDILHSVNFSDTAGAYEGGIFSALPGGLDGLNPDTGEINAKLSDPGDYTVTYTIPASNGCDSSTITAQVTIIQQPQASISYITPMCTSDETDYEVTFSGEAGNYLGGTFSGTEGLSIDANGVISPDSSSPGIHTITYTFPSVEGCETSETTTEVEIFAKPEITTEPQNLGICSSNPASFEVFANGEILSYQWYHKAEGGEFTKVQGATSSKLSFTNATSVNAGEYYVEVSGAGSCIPDVSETVTLNVDEEIVIIKPTEDQTFCDKEITEITFEFIAHANNAPLSFTWIKDGADISPDGAKYIAVVSAPQGENGEYTGTLKITDIGVPDNGVYAVRINGPDYFTCSEAVSKTFSLNINPLPEAPVTEAVQYCKGDVATALTATGGAGAVFRWYGSEFGDDFISETGPVPNTDIPGTTSYWVAQITETCESPRAELVVTIKDKPAVPETEAVNYCFGAPTSMLILSGADGSTINWYVSEDSETPLEKAPTPSSDTVGTTTYWVSQSTPDACESEKTPLVVTIDPLPDPVITADDTTICNGNSTILHATGGETYSWAVEGAEIGTAADLPVSPTDTTTFLLTATNANGCANTTEITINVDPATEAGTLTGPASVCESSPTGTLTLEGYTGEIIKWEHKPASATDWIAFDDGNLSASRPFSGLTQATSYRVTVKSGICEELTAETTVNVDPVPVGGVLAFAIEDTTKDGRIFLTCENPGTEYAVDLNITGQVGEIVGWKYRPSTSSTTWSTVMVNGEPFTGTTLLAEDIEALNLAQAVQTTVFTVEIRSGVCTSSAYSKTALFSVIPSDIEPAPVTVEPAVLCIGDTITLSSESGYSSAGGEFEGGAFDNAGIKEHGWRFTNLEGGSNDFSSAADNGRPDHWLRTTPKDKFFTADINTHVVTPQIWDSKLLPEGNDGFAIVTGDNGSLMETPVFSLEGLDEAVLTFDQAYNLTIGDTIWVELSINGGASYETVLFEMGGPKSSGFYDTFGDGTPETRPKNKMVFDLGAYMGYPNLRVRFNYQGNREGAVWAVDNIKVPDGPQDAQLIWYYDDPTTPPGDLEMIGEINQEVVPFIPEYIGWNAFQVQTEMILDSQGNTCHSILNQKDVQVFVFDKYTVVTTETVGPCGNSSVELETTITGYKQGDITNDTFPTDDGYKGQWKITDLAGNEITTGFELIQLDPDSVHDSAINDPHVRFTAENAENYIFTYELVLDGSAVYPDNYFVESLRGTQLTNPGCPAVLDPITVLFPDCTTLDFDGVDDYVELGTGYNASHSIEAWIRPFDRPSEGGSTNASVGTVISGPGYEINMTDLSGVVVPNSRWYHIATIGGNIYVDGVATGAKVSIGSSGKTFIGARWNASAGQADNFFSGWIEEVRIWKTPLTVDEIHMMMNQRLKIVGDPWTSTPSAETPVDGEIVPIRNAKSYFQDGANYNLYDAGGERWYDRKWGDLAGYYRLISEDPDPDKNLVSNEYKPLNGNTPNFADSANPGRLHNMETHQQNTSPVPYISGKDGEWGDPTTWLRPEVWDFPNSTSQGETITWNIAQTEHNLFSGDRDIMLLGLLVEVNELTIKDPTNTNPHWENQGQELRVTHYLKLNGVIDMYGSSQLLQDPGSIIDANSSGSLEIDQQGTANSYNYNYWTSPVSMGPRIGEGSGSMHPDYMIKSVLRDGYSDTPGPISYNYWEYFADGPWQTNPLKISSYWLYRFIGNANVYGQWLYVGPGIESNDLSHLEVGEGYSMKGTGGNKAISDRQNYTFKGMPNNGFFNNLSIGTDQNYLIGNPFPSALSADEFIMDNLRDVKDKDGKVVGRHPDYNVFDGTIYFWSHFGGGDTHILKEYVGGYASYNLSGGAKAYANDARIDNSLPNSPGGKEPGPFIPIGQAFFVNTRFPESLMKIHGGNIQFKNSQRVFVREGTTSVFLQKEDPKKKQKTAKDLREKIWFLFHSPDGYKRQLLVTADGNTTSEFDLGYDAPLIENFKEDMYWKFSNYQFVIQAVPDLSLNRELPLGVKTRAEGWITISIDKMENVPDNKPVFVKDTQAQIVHNLKESPYVVYVSGGKLEDRFEIVFKDEFAQIQDPPAPEIGVEILYLNSTREFVISNPQLVELYDAVLNNVLGQKVQDFGNIPDQDEARLPVKRFSPGVYIVKLNTAAGILTEKIIIEE